MCNTPKTQHRCYTCSTTVVPLYQISSCILHIHKYEGAVDTAIVHCTIQGISVELHVYHMCMFVIC